MLGTHSLPDILAQHGHDHAVLILLNRPLGGGCDDGCYHSITHKMCIGRMLMLLWSNMILFDPDMYCFKEKDNTFDWEKHQ